MMSNRSFDVIQNVVLATNVNQNGFGSVNTFQLPSLPPDIDEVIIKQISFYGPTPTGSYFIWSDLTNSNIANIVCDGSSQLNNCNIHIQIAPRTSPNNITLSLTELSTTNSFVPSADVGVLGITLQFIRFAR
jgi:hypothetical protein